MVEGLLPHTEDSITQFKDGIAAKLEALSDFHSFDNNALNAPVDPIVLMEMCTRKSALEEEQTLLAKASRIKEYPQLLNNDLMIQLAHADIAHVS